MVVQIICKRQFFKPFKCKYDGDAAPKAPANPQPERSIARTCPLNIEEELWQEMPLQLQYDMLEGLQVKFVTLAQKQGHASLQPGIQPSIGVVAFAKPTKIPHSVWLSVLGQGRACVGHAGKSAAVTARARSFMGRLSRLRSFYPRRIRADSLAGSLAGEQYIPLSR
jgi:hypothetical protein